MGSNVEEHTPERNTLFDVTRQHLAQAATDESLDEIILRRKPAPFRHENAFLDTILTVLLDSNDYVYDVYLAPLTTVPEEDADKLSAEDAGYRGNVRVLTRGFARILVAGYPATATPDWVSFATELIGGDLPSCEGGSSSALALLHDWLAVFGARPEDDHTRVERIDIVMRGPMAATVIDALGSHQEMGETRHSDEAMKMVHAIARFAPRTFRTVTGKSTFGEGLHIDIPSNPCARMTDTIDRRISGAADIEACMHHVEHLMPSFLVQPITPLEEGSSVTWTPLSVSMLRRTMERNPKFHDTYLAAFKHILMVILSIIKSAPDTSVSKHYAYEYAVGRAVEAAHLLNSTALLKIARDHMVIGLRTEMSTVVESIEQQHDYLSRAGAGMFDSEFVPATRTPVPLHLVNDHIVHRGKIVIARDKESGRVIIESS